MKHILENAASYCMLASKARTDSTTMDC
jgi:hypothetical protein